MQSDKKKKSTIYITQKGINLTDGLFIIQNIRDKQFSIISVDMQNETASLFTKTKTIKVSDVIKLETMNEIKVIGDAKINILKNTE